MVVVRWWWCWLVLASWLRATIQYEWGAVNGGSKCCTRLSPTVLLPPRSLSIYRHPIWPLSFHPSIGGGWGKRSSRSGLDDGLGLGLGLRPGLGLGLELRWRCETWRCLLLRPLQRASALCRIRHAAQAQHVALLGTCRTIPLVHEIALAGRNNRPTQESRRDQRGEAGQGQTTKGFWLGGGKEAKTQMQLCPAFICLFCFSFVLSPYGTSNL